jgi:bacteriocin-like protein
MEKIMSKTNETTKTRELTEAELAAVSGGFNLEECMISGVVASGGGAGPAIAAWNFRDGWPT